MSFSLGVLMDSPRVTPAVARHLWLREWCILNGLDLSHVV